jgi:DNA (cytosine-5)-methyltransferase 1
MKYLSICSGIEAATVAWHPLGWQPVGFAEIEPFPSAVLAHHWPDVPNLGDMTKHREWRTLRPDLIVGGTPCQAFSVAGLRKGLADPRGNLTLTFLAIVAQHRPAWVVWENVPGVLSDRTGAFGAFLSGLAELGYGWAYRVLDAQHFGVAQRRRRVFVVASAGGWGRAAAVLFERESLLGHPAPRREAGKVAPTIPSRSLGGGGLGTDFECDGGLIPEVAGCLQSLGRARPGDTADDAQWSLLPVAFAQNTRDEVRLQNGADAGATSDMRPCVASTTAVRRLTPRECERLQGFPDGHTLIPWRGKPDDQCPDGPRYKALGNSMAVPVMAWIGRRIQLIDSLP